MAGLQSLRKGKQGEREVVLLLQPVVNRVYGKVGWEPPRLQRNLMQSASGGYDVVGLDFLALEVKNHKTLNVNAWWDQTVRQTDRGKGQVPVLLYKVERKGWHVVTEGYMHVDADSRWRGRISMGLGDWLVWLEARMTAEIVAIKKRQDVLREAGIE